jgi:hypothetical protein
MKKILQGGAVLLCLCGALFVLSRQYIHGYPERSDIHPSVLQPPFQTDTDLKPFVFQYFGEKYLIEPVQEYEISGLVVSHNNVSSITDAYHTSRSVDFRDLCVVWGQNAKKDLLEQMEFWSAPWTCWTRAKTPNAAGRFFPDELSNNHLLARKNEVRERIKSARIGDQVRLRGYLINYRVQGSPDYFRKSSLVRDDTGNGACETIFVEEAEILKTTNSGWRALYTTSRTLSILLLVVLPILWILDIQRNYIRTKEDIARRVARSPHLRG